MSDIPSARQDLRSAQTMGTMDHIARRYVAAALSKMTREKPVRRASAKRRPITARMRVLIAQLAHTDLTEMEIARAVGLRSQGRISEVLHGKR